MRKLFVLFSCLLIISLSVVPAFAASDGSANPDIDDVPLYADIPFDYITTSDGVYEWPFNVGYRQGITDFDFGGRFRGNGYFGDIQFNADFLISDLDSFSLYSSFVLFDFSSSVPFYTISTNTDSIHFTFSEISFNVVTLDLSNESPLRYVESVEYLASVEVGEHDIIDVGSLVWKLLSNEGYDPGIVYLSDLTVSCRFERTDVDTPSFSVQGDISGLERGFYFGTWVMQHNLNVVVNSDNPAYFDVTSWASTAIGGFLSLEIAPGFSLDKIIWLVLTIGVLLAVFKMIR